MAASFFNIIVVPSDHSGTRQYRLSARLLWTAALLGVVLLVTMLVFILTYGRVLRTARDAEGLRVENRQLRVQVAMVDQLSADVEELSALRAQVLELLGSDEAAAVILPNEGASGQLDEGRLAAISENGLASLLVERTRSGHAPRHWPASGEVLREFAPAGNDAHPGISLRGEEGSPILAAGRGRVVDLGHDDELGNYVLLDHGYGFRSIYAHSQRILCQLGQVVEQGQEIAYLGRSGNVSSARLYFEVQVDGQAVDPRRYLNPRGS